ncbi:hypothetical protein KKF34_19010 [Myxococcota bacterium]|nr:hypothetical protein [Myxococcota bacterium]MBU1382829.1 hypothetical protein [Myxococcota bacterium]MBU1498978.1 hypothetical protein [Myxococcota bacterium]
MNEKIKNAALEKAKTEAGPFYIYDSDAIRLKCREFMNIPWQNKLITFASMANATPEFLKIVQSEGLGIFINSLGHMKIAEDCGFSVEKMVYTSSGMPENMMAEVGKKNLFINLDSPGQLKQWREIFPGSKTGIRCNIGDSVNPKKTRGGYFLGSKSRLGFTVEEIERLEGDKQISGLHLYLGTDILDIDYYRDCYEEIVRLSDLFPELEYLDFGGGFAVESPGGEKFDLTAYGKTVSELMETVSRRRRKDVLMILEPGRIIGGENAWFVVSVTDVKIRGEEQYVGVNASTAQFTRPLMYPDDAYHPVSWISEPQNGSEKLTTHIFGCSTYSRDFFAKDQLMQVAQKGDLIAFGHAGSYCASSYTTFLGFEKAKEFFI